MNDKQLIKYNLLKSALKARSFAWIDSPCYVSKGEIVYQDNSLCYSPKEGTLYVLFCKHGVLSLVRGDVSIILSFLCEYNQSPKDVDDLADKIEKIIKAKLDKL